MLKKRIIPVVQLMTNSVVKTVAFENPRQVGDSSATIKVFSSRKADELVLIDIGASLNGQEPNYKYIELAAKNCLMPLTIGGGISSFECAKKVFLAGADKIIIGNLLHENPFEVEKIVHHYGQQAVVISLDIRKIGNKYQSFSASGRRPSIFLEEIIIKANDCGAGEIFLTSIENEGLMQGYNIELVEKAISLTSLPIVINGGGTLEDMVESFRLGVSATAVSSIFFWEGLTIKDIKTHLIKNNILVTNF